MTLIIEGIETPIPFSFLTMKALAKSLGASKVADLEKMLNKIGFDNCVHLTGVMLRASGNDVKDAAIEASIEDPGYPIRLIEAIGKALTPEKNEVDAVVKSINEGN